MHHGLTLPVSDTLRLQGLQEVGPPSVSTIFGAKTHGPSQRSPKVAKFIMEADDPCSVMGGQSELCGLGFDFVLMACQACMGWDLRKRSHQHDAIHRDGHRSRNIFAIYLLLEFEIQTYVATIYVTESEHKRATVPRIEHKERIMVPMTILKPPLDADRERGPPRLQLHHAVIPSHSNRIIVRPTRRVHQFSILHLHRPPIHPSSIHPSTPHQSPPSNLLSAASNLPFVSANSCFSALI